MSHPSVISAAKFNPATDVRYAKPKVNKNGQGKTIGLYNTKTNEPLRLFTPSMMTWGVSDFRDESSGKVTYSLALQFPQADFSNAETDAFLAAMQAFHEKIRQDVFDNAKEWLGKTYKSLDVLDAMMTPVLKYPKVKETGEPDMTKMPTMKIKVEYYDNEFNTEVYSKNNKLLFPVEHSVETPVTLIPKQSQVQTVLQCGGIWFAAGKFGVTWKLLQAVVEPKPTLKGRCLINLGSGEDALVETPVVAARPSAVAAPKAPVSVDVADSDEDDDAQMVAAAEAVDDGDEEVADADVSEARREPSPSPTPAPEPPAKVKKVVRKAPVKTG
jgi:hypothetical protein